MKRQCSWANARPSWAGAPVPLLPRLFPGRLTAPVGLEGMAVSEQRADLANSYIYDASNHRLCHTESSFAPVIANPICAGRSAAPRQCTSAFLFSLCPSIRRRTNLGMGKPCNCPRSPHIWLKIDRFPLITCLVWLYFSECQCQYVNIYISAVQQDPMSPVGGGSYSRLTTGLPPWRLQDYQPPRMLRSSIVRVSTTSSTHLCCLVSK